MLAQSLRGLARTARVIASASDEADKAYLLTVADELDQHAADLESVCLESRDSRISLSRPLMN